MSDSVEPGWQQTVSEWQQKIDALQTRERVLLFAVVVVVLVALLKMMFLEPTIKRTALMKLQYGQVSAQITQQQVEKKQLEMILAAGVNKSKLARRDKLAVEMAKLDEKIQSSLLTLIPPKLMSEVLEKVLLENSQLKLMSLENRPVVALIEQKLPADSVDKKAVNGVTAKRSAMDHQGLYKHSFVIQLEGSYPAAVEYFKLLSELPWRFNWDALHYEVTQYPGRAS